MTAKKQFKGNSSELTWLCGIAKHLAIDECRKNKKLSELDEAGAASIVDIEKAIEDKDTALPDIKKEDKDNKEENDTSSKDKKKIKPKS